MSNYFHDEFECWVTATVPLSKMDRQMMTRYEAMGAGKFQFSESTAWWQASRADGFTRDEPAWDAALEGYLESAKKRNKAKVIDHIGLYRPHDVNALKRLTKRELVVLLENDIRDHLDPAVNVRLNRAFDGGPIKSDAPLSLGGAS